jgi:fatty-acyl-CoA synthase
MFHCDGWCFTWSVTAAGATHLCLPQVDPEEVWRMIRGAGVTHLSGAPTVLSMIAAATDASNGPAPRTVHVTTGGAPPSPALLGRMTGLQMSVTHLYGLTETFGPTVINQWKPEWDAEPVHQRSVRAARQGVGNVVSDRVRVVDPSGLDVAADGASMGEVVVRGNNVFMGYFHDEPATRDSTGSGWFRTGDLAVMYPDGYLEIRDRLKDIIISGGENISSIEVEQALDSHPGVLESGVVAKLNVKWGEVPYAFVVLRRDADTTSAELVAFARERLAGFKVPKRVVVLDALPKTATGKIQKDVLRVMAELDEARES